MKIADYLTERKARIDQALGAYMAQAVDYPEPLQHAMQYSLMAGGKRLRPVLTLAGAAAAGGDETVVLPCACALEMIHTFSLIHDDLPAMDNDDLRRGRPTSHKVFGEALAILAGDGLLAEAFWWLAGPALADRVPTDRILAVLRDIAEATGARGMVGGQVLDIRAEGEALTPAAVQELHRLKTGALIRVAVTSGAKLAGGDAETIAALRRYGEQIGLAFQIADDLLGVEGTAAELGKPVGSDAARRKATYPAMVGAEAARKEMTRLTAAAVTALRGFDERAEPLRLLALYITERRN